jgi:pilus assembly protein CpaC
LLATLLSLVLTGPVGEVCPPGPGVERVWLSLGAQKVLPVQGSVRLAPAGVVEVTRLSETQVQLSSVREGVTTLWVEDHGQTRTLSVVVWRPRYEPLSELKKGFPCGSTLDLRLVGERLFLDGEASSVAEWRAAFEALRQFPELVVLGHLAPALIEQEFRAANAALLGARLRGVQWVRAGEQVLLEGAVEEDQRPALAVLETEWRPRLELVLRKPRKDE